MGKRIYFGFSHDRQDWKNSHRKYSKLSKYKIEKILDCFVRDLTISEAWNELSSWKKNGAISKKTIGRKYHELQRLFVNGALTYLELFGGAGAISLIGVPNQYFAQQIYKGRLYSTNDNNDKVRIRPYKQIGEHSDPNFVYNVERALREYARHKLSTLEICVVVDFSIIKMLSRNIEEEQKSLSEYGYDYIAEKNWSSGDYDFGLRENELWDKICSTQKVSNEVYNELLLRDMKWLINRHPLKTRISQKVRIEINSASEVMDACRDWFPDGYKRTQ